jgi:hypothetical protein
MNSSTGCAIDWLPETLINTDDFFTAKEFNDFASPKRKDPRALPQVFSNYFLPKP